MSPGADLSAETIVVTCGAQQAIALLAQVFVDPGRTTVAIEDPGYPPAFEAFAAVGANMVGVPVDPQGILVERIPREARIVYVKAVGVGIVEVRSRVHAEPAASCVLFGFGRTDEADIAAGLAALRRAPTFSRSSRWTSTR